MGKIKFEIFVMEQIEKMQEQLLRLIKVVENIQDRQTQNSKSYDTGFN